MSLKSFENCVNVHYYNNMDAIINLKNELKSFSKNRDVVLYLVKDIVKYVRTCVDVSDQGFVKITKNDFESYIYNYQYLASENTLFKFYDSISKCARSNQFEIEGGYISGFSEKEFGLTCCAEATSPAEESMKYVICGIEGVTSFSFQDAQNEIEEFECKNLIAPEESSNWYKIFYE